MSWRTKGREACSSSIPYWVNKCTYLVAAHACLPCLHAGMPRSVHSMVPTQSDTYSCSNSEEAACPEDRQSSSSLSACEGYPRGLAASGGSQVMHGRLQVGWLCVHQVHMSSLAGTLCVHWG